jgi:hypothetical protein
MSWFHARRAAAAAGLAVSSLMFVHPSAAQVGGPFAGLGGRWAGSGQVRLEAGQTEALRCTASYVPRGGGSALGLSLRCASASNRIELRASLSARGSRVSGSWEERSFNAGGDIAGLASGGSLRLRFSGSISGSMLVTTAGSSQSISVRTDNSALRGVSVRLRRRN